MIGPGGGRCRRRLLLSVRKYLIVSRAFSVSRTAHADLGVSSVDGRHRPCDRRQSIKTPCPLWWRRSSSPQTAHVREVPSDRRPSAKRSFSTPESRAAGSAVDSYKGRRLCGSSCLSFGIGLAHPCLLRMEPVDDCLGETCSGKRLRASPTRNGEDPVPSIFREAWGVSCPRRSHRRRASCIRRLMLRKRSNSPSCSGRTLRR
jgi:hypothetical protein